MKEKESRCKGVYRFISPTNKIYVGSTTTSFKERFKGHESDHKQLSKKNIFYHSLRKHGYEQHRKEILWIADTPEKEKNIRLMESIYYLLYKHKGHVMLNSIVPNIDDIPLKHSEKTKKLLSQLKKGKNNSFYNKKHSKSSKQKMSQSRIDNIYSGYVDVKTTPCQQFKIKRKIIHPDRTIQYVQGDLVATYRSIGEVYRLLGYDPHNIYRCLQGYRKSAYNYLWKKYKETSD